MWSNKKLPGSKDGSQKSALAEVNFNCFSLCLEKKKELKIPICIPLQSAVSLPSEVINNNLSETQSTLVPLSKKVKDANSIASPVFMEVFSLDKVRSHFLFIFHVLNLVF